MNSNESSNVRAGAPATAVAGPAGALLPQSVEVEGAGGRAPVTRACTPDLAQGLGATAETAVTGVPALDGVRVAVAVGLERKTQNARGDNHPHPQKIVGTRLPETETHVIAPHLRVKTITNVRKGLGKGILSRTKIKCLIKMTIKCLKTD